MSLSRRAFVQSLVGGGAGALSGAVIAARGREALAAEFGAASARPVIPAPPDLEEIRISSNENPLGPGKVVVEALVGEFGQTGRYPFNSRIADSDLKESLAKTFHVGNDNVVLGAGSSEILRNAVRAFVSADRPLVTAEPSFENPVDTAKLLGYPVNAVPVDSKMSLDLDEMAKAARGAGLVFLCNPNNPTATVHSAGAVAEFVARVRRDSPETAILIDEAYHDYVTDPSYQTAVALGMSHPKVFVSRTFSKAYGMAGLRVGYAIGQVETINKLARLKLHYNVNVLGVAAAVESLKHPDHIAEESDRNTEVRKFTREFFTDAGFESTDSQTNFIFVNLGRPAKEFREACEKFKVKVGRDFPPFEKTHARISIGTMDEMRRATEVFRQVLGVPATNSQAGA